MIFNLYFIHIKSFIDDLFLFFFIYNWAHITEIFNADKKFINNP